MWKALPVHMQGRSSCDYRQQGYDRMTELSYAHFTRKRTKPTGNSRSCGAAYTCQRNLRWCKPSAHFFSPVPLSVSSLSHPPLYAVML